MGVQHRQARLLGFSPGRPNHPWHLGSAFIQATCAVVLIVALSAPFPARAGEELSSRQKLEWALDQIRSSYVGPVDEDVLVTRAIQGMVRELDEHSVFLDRTDYDALRQDMRGTFVGVGMEVALDQGVLTVLSAMEDAPAYQAGLRAGDLITTLNGSTVAGMTLEQALQVARGDLNSSLRLTVLRPGDDDPRLLTVTRALIPRATVRARLIESNLGYVRITQFRHSTPSLLVKTINQLVARSEQGLAALVLDLRDNPGGSLRAAVGVSAAFLPPDALVVSMQGPTVHADAALRATPGDYLYRTNDDYLSGLPASIKSLPMVVLIDGGSASAAEIVAAALQDYGRALLVGTPTFGKGTVQSIIPLGDGTALKLTVARYFTPRGRAISAQGIAPDVWVEEDRSVGREDARSHDDSDPQLARAMILLLSGAVTRQIQPQ